MMYRLPTTRRRGIVLLLVLAFLTLFAVVGISFVMYANATANSSRYFRESETDTRPDADPELLLNYFLSQLVFDAPDDETGVYSSLRGHSLARNMYGGRYRIDPSGSFLYKRANGQWLNDAPYNGTGRLHTVPPQGPHQTGDYNNPFSVDDYELINYTFFRDEGFLRDPERYTFRTDPHGRPGPFRGGFNAPYTYPDVNNLFLGAVKAGPLHIQEDGGFTGDFPESTLLAPSFYRPWLFRPTGFDPAIGTLDPRNPNWSAPKPEGKYRILRPRPVDQLLSGQAQSTFPYPEDEGGDVKNLIGAPGYYDPITHRLCNNDSMWLDLGFPVMTAPDGRKFKPLFAPLIVDLDNRVNLNVHGNLRGEGHRDHASNQGWGPWEVNPAKVLDHTSNEWPQLFAGAPGRDGKYGPYAPGLPSQPQSLANRALALGPLRPYAPADFDGSQEMGNGAPSEQLHIPDAFFYPTSCFPTVPLGYADTDQSQQAELVAHPSIYTICSPYAPNRAFDISNMEALLRYGDTGSGGLTSDLFHLSPLNFGDPNYPADAAKRRGLVTTHSFDIDRPGISPYFWQQPDRNAVNHLVADGYNPLFAPQSYGSALPFPSLSLGSPQREFGTDYRSAAALTALRRIDLNRHLPEYPEPGPDGLYPASQLEQFQVAQAARQDMAMEIFTVLWQVTGARDPGEFAGVPSSTDVLGQQEYNALRSLAQLAVNIVDFIDDDDVMTPFNWRANEWVFGTELPKVLINEVYAEQPTSSSRLASFWVELFNPLPSDPSLPSSGTVNLHGYQLLITGRNGLIRDPARVTGDPDRAAIDLGRFNVTDVIPPSNRGSGHMGYSVVGPPAMDGFVQPDIHKGLFGPITSPTVMVRRLACLGLPPQSNPTLPLFNPAITIDYMEEVHVNLFPAPLEARFSTARTQPYAGDVGHNVAELRPFVGGGRQQSLGMPNLNRAPKYDWYFHPDRKLISVMELLTVSAFKPHELTQQFLKSDILCNHRARWFDDDLSGSDFPSHRLHRALEFFTVHSPMLGMQKPKYAITAGPIVQNPPGQTQDVVPTSGAMAGPTVSGGTWEIRPHQSLLIRDLNNPRNLDDPANDDPTNEEVIWVEDPLINSDSGPGFTAHFWRNHPNGIKITPLTISDRVPGKININTIWDRETFLALCDPYDPQRSNNFGMQEASALFDSLMTSRSPKAIPDKDDHPFRSLATGYTFGDSPWFGTRGLEDTFLRPLPGDMSSRRLFEIDNPDHPYLRYELMTKISNNVTVRSNVFACWLTVGFFEAYDTDPATGESLRPVRLGSELHRAEGRQVRHRMFAIIDRSVLTANPGPQPTFNLRDRFNTDYSTGPVVPYYSIID